MRPPETGFLEVDFNRLPGSDAMAISLESGDFPKHVN